MMLKMFLKMLSSSRCFRITEHLANIRIQTASKCRETKVKAECGNLVKMHVSCCEAEVARAKVTAKYLSCSKRVSLSY